MPATSIAGDQMRVRLQQLGLGAERTIVAIIWAHGPLLAAAAALAGNDVLITLLLWLAVALCATLAHRLNPATTATHVTVAAAFCLMPALLLRALDGHPWQVDAHMHFFAVLAVCASMLDVWAVLAGAAVVAVHHLLLNFIYSTMVFPGGADLGRVVFHAVILIFEAAALFWLVRNTAHALVAAEQASAEITRHDKERQVAGAHLEQSRVDDRRQGLREMADTVEETTRDVVDSLRNEAEEMVLQANMMADLTVSVSQDADVAARSAAEALAKADAVTETSEELQSSIELITTRIGRAGEITQSAVISGTTAANMIALLSDATDRIGAVVQLIDSIAKQTNLLALNATIEAARAGDAGKGFAVVASEVKELANQTGRSTGEISRQVHEIREQTAAAVAVVRDVGKSLEEIAVVSASIAEAVGQQAQLTRLIARNVHENADSVRALSAAITSVSSQASISGEQSDAVRMTSVSMSSNVSGMCSRILAIIRGSITDLNRRVAPRVPVDLPCVIAMFGAEHAGRIVDMSTGGCRLSPSHFVSDGAATIRLNAGGKTLSVACMMEMDQLDGTCRAVFDSATLTDETRDAIAAMLLRQAA